MSVPVPKSGSARSISASTVTSVKTSLRPSSGFPITCSGDI